MAKKATKEVPAPSTSDEMRIEYVALDEVKKWPRNPKLHDEKSLDGSIGRFGYCDPLTIDEGTGHLVEGHGRVEALVRRRAAGKTPPDRIKVDAEGRWHVPVVRGVRFKDELEAEAYVVAHNKISEAGGWDDALLAEVLSTARQLSFEGLGFSSEEADKIIEASQARNSEEGDDDLPDVPKKAVAKKGDIWILGDHRLLCGDSSDAPEVARMLGDDPIDFLFSSPPYNVGIKYGDHNDKTVPWEEYGAFLRRVLEAWQGRVAPGRAIGWNIGASPMCYPAQQLLLFEQLGWRVHRTMVWNKTGVSKPTWHNTESKSVTRYFTPHYTFEYVHVLKRDDLEPGIVTAFDDTLSKDVFVMSPSESKNDRDAKSEKHPAPFPVRLPLAFIAHFADRGAIVADCFNGSGTTMIACERSGRRFVGCELDPRYVDVTVERWQRITGGKAKRA